ncbi:phosphotransferase family protein [Rhodococcus gannanensis]|uniref:Phosphotransferase family protein n=1 Tax=Rhodococcus gannanensis TaxID=1960308 RepID=A0ABW4P8X3_9NOCA
MSGSGPADTATVTGGRLPGTPREVTPEWLGSVLAATDDQVIVDAVEITPVGTGQTAATYHLAVRYRRRGAGLPDTFVLKLPSQDLTVRDRVALGYRSEHAFYTGVAESTEIPVPRCFHCEIADEGREFVLLLEDLAPATQGDQIRGCGLADALLAVEALAGLHGPGWCDPKWAEFTGTVMPKPADAAAATGLGDVTKLATATTVEKLAGRLSADDVATLQEAADLVGAWLMLEPDRFGILHGDYRLDNLMFHPDGDRLTVVDWQTTAVGMPARDLAYFIGTSFEPAVRAEYERELVDAYHRALTEHGVVGYPADECWDDYRISVLQMPMITTLGFAFAASTERGDDMIVTMLERGCAAIRDLGSLDLIRGRL